MNTSSHMPACQICSSARTRRHAFPRGWPAPLLRGTTLSDSVCRNRSHMLHRTLPLARNLYPPTVVDRTALLVRPRAHVADPPTRAAPRAGSRPATAPAASNACARSISFASIHSSMRAHRFGATSITLPHASAHAANRSLRRRCRLPVVLFPGRAPTLLLHLRAPPNRFGTTPAFAGAEHRARHISWRRVPAANPREVGLHATITPA